MLFKKMKTTSSPQNQNKADSFPTWLIQSLIHPLNLPVKEDVTT
jgi:hypothetical protein